MNGNSTPWWARVLYDDRWELTVVSAICFVVIITAAVTWP